jgi:drug/metabolite transporter (DMT)-like permease
MSETPDLRARRLRADAVLVAVTVVWGSSFIVVKDVVRDSPPLAFLFWRFLLASALVLPLALRRRGTPRLFKDGLAVGLLLAVGMAFQVVGQTETTASKAAFLTGLSVVLTPFAAFIRTRRLPSLENGVGIALASLGFFLLTFPSGAAAFDRGDLSMTACGIVFAFYVVELGERTAAHDPLRFTGVQLAVVAFAAGTLSLLLRTPALSGLRAAAFEARPVVWRGAFLWGVLYLGSIGAVGTFLGQAWAQRHMSATHAAIIFALEPVVAAVLAAWLLGERLGPRGAAGGAIVLAGIVVSELRPRKPRVDDRPSHS